MRRLDISKGDWELAGHFGVDAGIVWIGDPCYILHKEKEKLPDTLGKDWGDFCNKLGDEITTFGYRPDHPEGLGVVVQTGYGDGLYPVYVHRDDGVIAAIFIDFTGIFRDHEEEEEDEEETRYCSECGDEMDDDECTNIDCEECPDYEAPTCQDCGEDLDYAEECQNLDCPNCPDYEDPDEENDDDD